mmetsp:Transcript_38229/g.80167  ORF Transcript_38229/g.80167 Transcript_38229/m.80167 type:complete len:200 (-) Transcript_38229:888-1487(-)
MLLPLPPRLPPATLVLPPLVLGHGPLGGTRTLRPPPRALPVGGLALRDVPTGRVRVRQQRQRSGRLRDRGRRNDTLGPAYVRAEDRFDGGPSVVVGAVAGRGMRGYGGAEGEYVGSLEVALVSCWGEGGQYDVRHGCQGRGIEGLERGVADGEGDAGGELWGEDREGQTGPQGIERLWRRSPLWHEGHSRRLHPPHEPQ